MYIAEIETRVAGIPCIIGVSYYNRVEGSYSYHAASDWDYHGYTEADWDVLDRRGRAAPWLAKKLTSDDESRIEREIGEYFSDDGY
jgi:hypothetical protein